MRAVTGIGGLAALSLDAMASVAHGSEAIVIVLAVAGGVGLEFMARPLWHRRIAGRAAEEPDERWRDLARRGALFSRLGSRITFQAHVIAPRGHQGPAYAG